MTLNDAESIRKMIDGHWNLKMNNETADLWLGALMSEDAAQATAVVVRMTQKLHFAPKIVDFKEFMRLLYPPVAAPAFEPLPESKRGVEAPEWVWVWSWARWKRDPAEKRPFPQQDGHVDGAETMAQSEHAALLAEWKDAGCPKAAHPLPLTL